MTDLIERYVAAALERIPEDRQQEVGKDIRGAIDEMVTPRIENGEPEDAAVRAVLTELGDPARLAGSYHERKQYLIGPGWYPAYVDVLKRVLTIALPIIAVIAALVTVADSDSDLGDVLSSGIGSVFEVGIQIIFWVTLGFFIAERTSGTESPLTGRDPWTVDDLPEQPVRDRQIGIPDTLLSVITTVAFGALAFVQHDGGIGAFVRGIDESYEHLPAINPDLGSGWAIGFYLLLGVSLIAAIVRYLNGYWTRPMVILTVAEAALWSAFAIALAMSEPIFNPELARRIDESSDASWWEAGGSANWIAAIVVIAINGWEVWEAWQGNRQLDEQRRVSAAVA